MRRSLVLIATAVAVLGSIAQATQWRVTAVGMITIVPRPDGAILFRTPMESLIGTPFTETITTYPTLNSNHQVTPNFNATYGGPGFGSTGGTGAPDFISITVNGVTYTFTETAPYVNYAY